MREFGVVVLHFYVQEIKRERLTVPVETAVDDLVVTINILKPHNRALDGFERRSLRVSFKFDDLLDQTCRFIVIIHSFNWKWDLEKIFRAEPRFREALKTVPQTRCLLKVSGSFHVILLTFQLTPHWKYVLRGENSLLDVHSLFKCSADFGTRSDLGDVVPKVEDFNFVCFFNEEFINRIITESHYCLFIVSFFHSKSHLYCLVYWELFKTDKVSLVIFIHS